MSIIGLPKDLIRHLFGNYLGPREAVAFLQTTRALYFLFSERVRSHLYKRRFFHSSKNGIEAKSITRLSSDLTNLSDLTVPPKNLFKQEEDKNVTVYASSGGQTDAEIRGRKCEICQQLIPNGQDDIHSLILHGVPPQSSMIYISGFLIGPMDEIYIPVIDCIHTCQICILLSAGHKIHGHGGRSNSLFFANSSHFKWDSQDIRDHYEACKQSKITCHGCEKQGNREEFVTDGHYTRNCWTLESIASEE